MRVIAPLGRRLRYLLLKETGAVTVEGVLWVPIYGVFFALIVDVSLMFNGQSQMRRIVQDVNRLASNGYLARTPAEIEVASETRALASLQHLSSNAVVETIVDDDLKIVTTVATIPSSDLQATGILAVFGGMNIVVTAYHVMES